MTLQFTNRDSESSVYCSVSNVLRNNRTVWREVKRCEETEATFNFDLMFGEKNLLPYHRLGQNPGLLQLVNYYRGAGNICRKCSMVRTFKRAFEPEDLRKWLPESFIIFPNRLMDTAGGDNADVSEREILIRKKRQACDERVECCQYHEFLKQTLDKVVWIAKSSAGCKGEGIRISEDVDELLVYIDKHKQGFILQRYIIHPMLLPGDRKFDIRILKEQYNMSFEDDIRPQIYRIIARSVSSIKEDISTESLGYRSFQLFGFDFLLDMHGVVWLLEVNGAPASAHRLLCSLTDAIVQGVINPFFMDEVDESVARRYFDDITDVLTS